MNKANLLENNKTLMKEYNFNKNKDIDLNTLTCGSGKKVWWKCKNGHEWEAVINSRNQGIGCPYCSNQRVLEGYNDVKTVRPDLVDIWNYSKNKVQPNEVICGGKRKYWWKCEKGHEWTSIVNPNIKIFCPICCNKKLLSGFNDLYTKNKELSKEYDTNKNKIPANKVLYSIGSHKKYWWKCEKNHYYETSIWNRVVLKSNCPYCSNQKTIKGYNDLMLRDDLANEWNYEKNKGIDPYTININSTKKYWWKCKKGHEWEMSPYKRKGCPFCDKEKKTSLPEKIIYYYVKLYFDNAKDNYSPEGLGQKNIDIYIPEIKVGIEYDGGHYHRDIEKDILKDNICDTLGIKLYRIREYNCPKLFGKSICIVLKDNSFEELSKAIEELLLKININTSDINIFRDLDKIYELIDYSEKKNSLQELYPELLKEWDYEKNGSITPDLVGAKSTKIVWWKCQKGHSYQSRIEDKTHKGNGCPICANRRVQEGYNDLAFCNPKLASEWNFEKNVGILPNQVVYGGYKKYWWKCKKDHEWEASIRVRIKGNGCPYCANKKILKGYNDLATTNPKLASEWNYEKNKELKPSDVFSGSGKKVWWKCKNGHEWEATPNNRSRGRKCPYCL